MNNTYRYAFIGAGNMSAGIIGGMLAGGVNPQSIITSTRTQASGQLLVEQFGVANTQDNNACLDADIVVLAVKPQIITQVLAELDTDVLAKRLIVTVIAGVPCKIYFNHLGKDIRLVRSMPNMPAKIGQGMTGMYAENCSDADKQTADKLLQYAGKTMWVEQESGIDFVNAISGSGPAYVYAFIHHLATAGENLGLSYRQALELSVQTLIGSAQLAERENDGSAAAMPALIAQITPKGGTTLEAMQSFDDDQFAAVVERAVQRCYKRAIELGELY